MKHCYTLFLGLLAALGTAQNISFPDTAFKAALLATADTDSDGEVSEAEAAATTVISLSGSAISNLSGIEYFTNVISFSMTDTQVNVVDLSLMTGLYDLTLQSNPVLTSVLVTGQPSMGIVTISQNNTLSGFSLSGVQQLATGLTVSQNPMLTSIGLESLTNAAYIRILNNNMLTGLDFPELQGGGELRVESNHALPALDISGTSFNTVTVISHNYFFTLNISNLYVTSSFNLFTDYLAELDISSLSVGPDAEIRLEGLGYESIDLVGPWSQMTTGKPSLFLINTGLRSLSFDPPIKLSLLHVGDNYFLDTISFRNGSFDGCSAGECSIDNFEFGYLQPTLIVCTDPFEVFSSNPEDQISGTDWVHALMGPDTIVLENCGEVIDIPDPNFKNALVNTICAATSDWTVDDDVDLNDDGEIQVFEALRVRILDIPNQGIGSLAGIENFITLTVLDCSQNNLTELVIGEGMRLASLDCSYNQVTHLDVKFLADSFFERVLDASNNQMNSIELFDSSTQGIEMPINLSNNQFTDSSLFSGYEFGSVNLSGNPFVTFTGSFETIYLSNCPLLTSCEVYAAVSASISSNPQLTYARLGSSGVSNVQYNPLLQSVSIKDGYAPYFDMHYPAGKILTNNPSLEFVCIDDLGRWIDDGDEMIFLTELSIVDTDPGVAITYYCDYTPGGGFNTLDGVLLADCSANLPATSNVKVNMDRSNNGTIEAVAFPDSNGNYKLYTNGSGTLTPEIESGHFTVSPVNAPYAFTGAGNIQTNDFCITSNGQHPDLDIVIIPLVPARPGFDATYKLKYSNKGTGVQSGTVAFVFEDDIMDLVSSVPGVSTQADGVLSWNFTDLNPFESREIDLRFNVNSPVETPQVNNGDILSFSATVNGADDETPADNQWNLDQLVVGSFDPNDKLVSRTSISPDQLNDYLYYTIRFENTGTYLAEKIAIRDLLSTKLDLSTLEIVATSHLCRSLLSKRTNNSTVDKLEFFFEDIMLPTTQDDPVNSHGFVTYRIKPKSNLVIGDAILNKAEIYFDYNAPIVTNEVTTTVTALGRFEASAPQVVLYPNPASRQFTVRPAVGSQIKSVSIHNIVGQKIRRIAAQNQSELAIDTAELPAGTYLIEIELDHGTVTKKLMKL